MAVLTFSAFSDFIETLIAIESKTNPQNATLSGGTKRDLPSWIVKPSDISSVVALCIYVTKFGGHHPLTWLQQVSEVW